MSSQPTTTGGFTAAALSAIDAEIIDAISCGSPGACVALREMLKLVQADTNLDTMERCSLSLLMDRFLGAINEDHEELTDAPDSMELIVVPR